jgi:hypothetical protein
MIGNQSQVHAGEKVETEAVAGPAGQMGRVPKGE